MKRRPSAQELADVYTPTVEDPFTSSTSRSRPTELVHCSGRLFRGAIIMRIGRHSAGDAKRDLV
jgi:hypothetical protein